MEVYRGIVRDSTVVLEPGARLPEGAAVEVRLLVDGPGREESFRRVLARRIERLVGMDAIIEEDKREREEHPDAWL